MSAEDHAFEIDERPQRFIGFDVARCLAYFGMVVVNYKVVMQSSEAPDPVWLNDLLDLFSGRAAATFVILAGIGLSLLHRAKKNYVRTSLTRVEIVKNGLRHLALLFFLLSALVVIDQHVASSAGSGAVETPGFTTEGSNDAFFAGIDRGFTHLGQVQTSSFLTSSAVVVSVIVLFLFLLGRRSFCAEAIVFRRVLFLAAFGYAWYPLWTGDILHFYACYFLIGLLLLRAKPLVLGAMVALALLTTVGARFQWDFFADWRIPALEYDHLFTASGSLRNLFFNGWHPVAPWICFFLIGMVIAKFSFDRRRTMLVMVIVGLSLACLGYQGEDWYRAWHKSRFISDFRTESALTAESAAKTPNHLVQVAKNVDTERHAKLIRAAKKMNTVMHYGDEHLTALKLGFEVRVHGETGARAHMTVFEEKLGTLSAADFDKLLVYLIEWIAFNDALPIAARWPQVIFPIAVERNFETGADYDTVWLDPETVRGHNIAAQMGSVSSLPPGPLYVISATGVALTLIGLSLLIASFPVFHKLLAPLVKTGQMALTLYVAHIALGFGIADILGKLQSESLNFITFWIIIAQILSVAFACWWRSFFKRGPGEALMRFLTG